MLTFAKVTEYADGQLTEMTRQEVYESTDLEDWQKTAINRALDFTEPLGWKVWLATDVPALFIEIADNSYSDVISLDSAGALKNVTYMAELAYACLDKSADHDHVAKLGQHIAHLEALLADVNKDVQVLTAQDEYQYYLKRFQEKVPVFEAYDLKLTIDKEAREAIYQNGHRCPVHYPISHARYNQALRALNHVKVRHKK